MRQYVVFPIVFGCGLILGGFMPSRVGTLELRSKEKIWVSPGNNSIGGKPPPAPSPPPASSSVGLKISDGARFGRPTQLRVDGDFLIRESRKPFMNLPKEADCDPRAHILVINSEGHGGQQARDHINREFTKAGLVGHFHFWPAESASSKDEARAEIESDGHVLRLSHRKIYETLLYMKWACATIFEDNVRLVDDFLARLTSITVTDSIPPFDMIFWGGNRSEKETKKPELTYGLPGENPGLFAYTVSLQGALFLLENGTSWDPIRSKEQRAGRAGSYWHVVPTMAFQ